MDRKALGRWGEQAAAEYLEEKGYRVIGMNWSCRFGEIDVIAADRMYVAFVEVKLRKDAAHGAAREFVTAAKQRRLILAARYWLQAHPKVAEAKQPRFDVVEVYGSAGKVRELNHIENAFTI